MRYLAKSASSKTDDWPFWYVADMTMGGLNVTTRLIPDMRGLPFLPKEMAETLADLANKTKQ